jgi:hypothetical protein
MMNPTMDQMMNPTMDQLLHEASVKIDRTDLIPCPSILQTRRAAAAAGVVRSTVNV